MEPMFGINPYGAPSSTQPPPAWMQPVQTVADRLTFQQSGLAGRSFDPLFDKNLGGYAYEYPYKPEKWLGRYLIEGTVGTKGSFANLKKALFGNVTAQNMPKWVDKWDKAFNNSTKLFNIADAKFNNEFYNNIHSNPFAESDKALAEVTQRGGQLAPQVGSVAMQAGATSPKLYGMKALNYDELFGLSNTEKARIGAIRKQYGWTTALKETFHKNRLAHAKDVLTEGGKTGGLRNFWKKVLINNEARWLTEGFKKGEVLPAILRPLSMGLFGFEVVKATKRSYNVSRKEGKSTLASGWDAFKTAVTKGAKLFATWHLGNVVFKGLSLALGTAIGLPAMATGVLSILGAVAAGWVANNAVNTILPDPPVYE